MKELLNVLPYLVFKARHLIGSYLVWHIHIRRFARVSMEGLGHLSSPPPQVKSIGRIGRVEPENTSKKTQYSRHIGPISLGRTLL